jgi:hypothetical protein
MRLLPQAISRTVEKPKKSSFFRYPVTPTRDWMRTFQKVSRSNGREICYFVTWRCLWRRAGGFLVAAVQQEDLCLFFVLWFPSQPAVPVP